MQTMKTKNKRTIAFHSHVSFKPLMARERTEKPLKSYDASFCLLTRRQSSNFMIQEGAVNELSGSVKRMWGVS